MKNVNYQTSPKSYMTLWINSKEEEEVIRFINNEVDKEKKRNRTYRKHNISSDMLQEAYQIELPSQGLWPNQILDNHEREELIKFLLDKLTEKQKTVVQERTFSGKTFREIAIERDVCEKTVRESYQSALKKMKKILIEQLNYSYLG